MDKKFWVVMLLVCGLALFSLACGGEKDTEEPAVGDTGQTKPVDATGDAGMKAFFANAKQGFEFFKDPALGGSENDMTCMTCHPYGGAGGMGDMLTDSMIGVADEFPKAVDMVADKLGEDPITLTQMINFCITNPLMGTALAEDDPTMLALLDFHKVLVVQTYEADALPIITKSCGGCHTGDAPTTGISLDNKDIALEKVEKLRELVDSGAMPKGGALDAEPYLKLIVWATNEIDAK
jgi:hypothetical protein